VPVLQVAAEDAISRRDVAQSNAIPMEWLNAKASRLVRATLAQLRPPPEIPLAEWIEEHVQLPEGLSKTPPNFARLWKNMPSTEQSRCPLPLGSAVIVKTCNHPECID